MHSRIRVYDVIRQDFAMIHTLVQNYSTGGFCIYDAYAYESFSKALPDLLDFLDFSKKERN